VAQACRAAGNLSVRSWLEPSQSDGAKPQTDLRWTEMRRAASGERLDGWGNAAAAFVSLAFAQCL